jgi:hypothetical protein
MLLHKCCVNVVHFGNLRSLACDVGAMRVPRSGGSAFLMWRCMVQVPCGATTAAAVEFFEHQTNCGGTSRLVSAIMSLSTQLRLEPLVQFM